MSVKVFLSFWIFFVTLVFARHEKTCLEAKNECGHCPIDPRVRVAQLIEVFNGFRGGDVSDLAHFLARDFVSYVATPQDQCRIDIFARPVMFEGFQFRMLQTDDWININRDGSVDASFTYVIFRSAAYSTIAIKIKQKWIKTEGTCNFSLEREDYTDYRCLASS